MFISVAGKCGAKPAIILPVLILRTKKAFNYCASQETFCHQAPYDNMINNMCIMILMADTQLTIFQS